MENQSSRNAFMLKGKLSKRGYDWWWHSLVGTNKKTGERKPFFIEYYVINPALSKDEIVLGQSNNAKVKGLKPSYAMIKAGAWGKDAKQIHNFYPISSFYASDNKMDVKIGNNTADDYHLKGSVMLSESDALNHPEYMSQWGSMSWDLKANKTISYSVGYGASKLFRWLDAFMMYWHVEGMKTEYVGIINFDGEEYLVSPENSYGYQDKNWGWDYTNPWIWLNCNCFKSKISGKILNKTSLDIGGGKPLMFGMQFNKKFLMVFNYEGQHFEFNFSKFWKFVKQEFNCYVTDEKVSWKVNSSVGDYKLEVDFSCLRNTMLLCNYENPDGQKLHTDLWNGGYAQGTVKIWKKENRSYKLIDELEGEMGGCEFGEY
ncbi:MAG: tocopherol cyclase family protein [Bacteroidota bacterium]